MEDYPYVNKKEVIDDRHYPALSVAPNAEQRNQLMILLDRVKDFWIDGVLKTSLYHDVLISLDKREMDEAVQPPTKHYIELSEQRHNLKSKERSILTEFDVTGLLLILGEPGSGKTTTMLDLASKMVKRVVDDPKERVPIILNLSNWPKGLALCGWMIWELSAKYHIPEKIGLSWLKNDYLLPLLDGLDEVKSADQADCVAAINQYIEKFGPSGLVVCCRLMAYQRLPEKLNMNGAICLESLSFKEVDAFVNRGGPQLLGLRQAMDTDSILKELSQTPLMLGIMSKAFEGMSSDDIAKESKDSIIQSRNHIFKLYVDRIFQKKEDVNRRYSRDKVIQWLTYLARGMKQHSQSVFMVESLQPSWLHTMGQLVLYRTISSLILGIIVWLAYGILGLGFWLSSSANFAFTVMVGAGLLLVWGVIAGLSTCIIVLSGRRSGALQKNGLMGALGGIVTGLIARLSAGLMAGLIVGLIFGLSAELISGPKSGLMFGLTFGLTFGLIGGVGVGSLKVFPTIETPNWQWRHLWRKPIQKWQYILIIGLVFGIIDGLLVGFFNGLSYGLVAGLIIMLGCGLLSVMTMTDTVNTTKTRPNRYIILSLKNALMSLLLVGLLVGLAIGLIWTLMLGMAAALEEKPFIGLIPGLIVGLISGLIAGLNRGGSAVIKHYSLRLAMWIKGGTPLNLIGLLDFCSGQILLRKVGGGYMFIHRELLEYFAENGQK